tara:strand:- start:435 stop:2642 length:2208 start_codon:yes stop_codon:yes gene_type:complete
MKYLPVAIAFFFLPILATAQEQPEYSNFELSVSKTPEHIVIDGILDEEAWENAAVTSEFLNKYPFDTGVAVNQTVARITYDDENLYIGAIAYQKRENIIVKTLKRDHSEHVWNSESVIITMDPFNQQTNGFVFLVSAAGVQSEGIIKLENSQTRSDFNWNNVWWSDVKVYDDYWTAEIKIPLKSINFDPSVDVWGINFLRKDMHENVWSSWRHIPIAFNAMDLGHQGIMTLEESLKKQKQGILFQPYLLTSGNQNFQEDEDLNTDFDIGLDAKIPIGSTLNMDLTVNPDFSTVDVDQQVTNLSRFSIFFPEKRSFFLENSDLFSSFGTWSVKPFFSRQIGISDGNLVPILFGSRVTGNLTNNLRVGALNVQTRSIDGIGANNYLVGAVQQKLFGRSSIKALVTNRSAFDGTSNTTKDFNRTLGGEFHYSSDDGTLTGNARYHWSQTEEKLNDASFIGATISYDDGKKYAGITADRLGDNFINELGFSSRSFQYDAERDSIIRIGYNFLNGWTGYIFRNVSESINFIDVGVWGVYASELDGKPTDKSRNFYLNINSSKRGVFEFSFKNEEIRLMFPANLIGGEEFLPAKSYLSNSARFNYQTDSRGRLSGTLMSSYGGFFDGTRFELGGSLNVRAQPWGNFGVNYIMNKVELPENYGEATLHLFGPQAEISFSNTLNWTTFMQYNTQAENFNINSRVQWRYAAMSDIYLVYNENYGTENFGVKNRGMVFKMNYWFN